MDDKLTSTFLRLCQDGSIRAVAIALEQEPSTISRRLSALERELNIQLLERRKKGVKPTEAGELLWKHLRGQAAEFEALTSQFDALRGMRRGRISLAVGEGFISDLTKNALPGFKKAYPEIALKMHSGSTETVVQDIENDTAHLGFVFNASPDPLCKILARMEQRLELVINPASDWARVAAPVSLKSLAAMPAAMLSSGSGIGSMVREVETAHGVRFNRVLEANSLAAVRSFAREGLGIAVLPAFVVAQEIAEGTLVTLPLNVPEFARGEVSLIARAGRRLPEVAMKLANHAISTMQAFASEL